MIETKEKYIDGHKYTVTQFPARRALTLKTKLVKLVAPSLFTAMSGQKQGASVLDMPLDKAINMLVERLDEDHLINLIFELLASTRRDGKELNESHFNMVYAGNFGELYKALFFILEVNFGSFFQEIGIGNLGEHLAAPTMPIPASES